MTDLLKNKIEKLEAGYVFTADEFEETAKSPTTVSKTLNEFVAEGFLRKLSKGRFYKPKQASSANFRLMIMKHLTQLVTNTPRNGVPSSNLQSVRIFIQVIISVL
jgi:DNA-binding transcriptional regulator YhcF (GntR family)